jgi:hypothetical protein
MPREKLSEQETRSMDREIMDQPAVHPANPAFTMRIVIGATPFFCAALNSCFPSYTNNCRGGQPPLLCSVGWWSRSGSNRRPQACKARALPTELRPQISDPNSLAILTERPLCERAPGFWAPIFKCIQVHVHRSSGGPGTT